MQKIFPGSTLNLRNQNLQDGVYESRFLNFFLKLLRWFFCKSRFKNTFYRLHLRFVPSTLLFKRKVGLHPSFFQSWTPPCISHIQSGNPLGFDFKIYLESCHFLPLLLLISQNKSPSSLPRIIITVSRFPLSLLLLILNIVAKAIL